MEKLRILKRLLLNLGLLPAIARSNEAILRSNETIVESSETMLRFIAGIARSNETIVQFNETMLRSHEAVARAIDVNRMRLDGVASILQYISHVSEAHKSELASVADIATPKRFDRRTNLLGTVDVKQAVGLEFGALTTPIISKSEGRIYYIDHDTTENIRKKYQHETHVDPAKVVDIDFVTDGRPLADIVGGMKFDYIFASHVFEHLPNPIAWLQECATVLKPNGLLALAIPDRRLTFDVFRTGTQLHEWIGAYIERRQKPSPATVFENATMGSEYCFPRATDDGELPAGRQPIDYRWAYSHACEAAARYIDVHCTACTAESFTNLIQNSATMGLHGFEVEALFPVEPGYNEFHIRLRLAAQN